MDTLFSNPSALINSVIEPLFNEIIKKECIKGNTPTVLNGIMDVYRPEELKKNKLSYGFLPDGRKFLAISVKINGEKYFQYFFQCDEDNETNWRMGDVGKPFINADSMIKPQAELLAELYEGDSVVLTEVHWPMNRGLVGKSVKMC